jgi:hypothetical protein
MNDKACVTTPSPDAMQLIDIALKVGKAWIGRISMRDRRRPKILEMTAYITDCLNAKDSSLATIATVRNMICINCSRMHPGLAHLCAKHAELPPDKLERCRLL